jgi:hypothetical protein
MKRNRREYEQLFAKRGLVVFSSKYLSRAFKNPPISVKRHKLTMTCDASDEPPKFAITGGVRCIIRKVAMNGALPCDTRVAHVLADFLLCETLSLPFGRRESEIPDILEERMDEQKNNPE